MITITQTPQEVDLPDLCGMPPADIAALIKTNPQLWNAAKQAFDRVHLNPYTTPVFDLSGLLHARELGSANHFDGVKIDGINFEKYNRASTREKVLLRQAAAMLRTPKT